MKRLERRQDTMTETLVSMDRRLSDAVARLGDQQVVVLASLERLSEHQATMAATLLRLEARG